MRNGRAWSAISIKQCNVRSAERTNCHYGPALGRDFSRLNRSGRCRWRVDDRNGPVCDRNPAVIPRGIAAVQPQMEADGEDASTSLTCVFALSFRERLKDLALRRKKRCAALMCDKQHETVAWTVVLQRFSERWCRLQEATRRRKNKAKSTLSQGRLSGWYSRM